MDFPWTPSYHSPQAAMTRNSIETAAKGLIFVIFVIFLFSTYRVLEMMGLL